MAGDIFDFYPSDEPPKEFRPGGGRPAKPWFRTSMQSWYVKHDGKQVNLGPDPQKAQERFLELKRGGTVSSR